MFNMTSHNDTMRDMLSLYNIWYIIMDVILCKVARKILFISFS